MTNWIIMLQAITIDANFLHLLADIMSQNPSIVTFWFWKKMWSTVSSNANPSGPCLGQSVLRDLHRLVLLYWLSLSTRQHFSKLFDDWFLSFQRRRRKLWPKWWAFVMHWHFVELERIFGRLPKYASLIINATRRQAAVIWFLSQYNWTSIFTVKHYCLQNCFGAKSFMVIILRHADFQNTCK